MNKLAIIYWSGTGNTESMANIIEASAKSLSLDAMILALPDVNKAALAEYTAVALGCPSMGAEVLEESEFEPLWQDIKGYLAGKKVALFGSYGWGDGEWMRNWIDDAENANINVVANVICQDSPDSQAESELLDLAKALV